MSELEYQLCRVVGGPNDGELVNLDARMPTLTLRRAVALQDCLLPPFDRGLNEPAPRFTSDCHRMELLSSDGVKVHSVVIYHHESLRPWEALRMLVENYRG